jgi:hypothetical protein
MEISGKLDARQPRNSTLDGSRTGMDALHNKILLSFPVTRQTFRAGGQIHETKYSRTVLLTFW